MVTAIAIFVVRSVYKALLISSNDPDRAVNHATPRRCQEIQITVADIQILLLTKEKALKIKRDSNSNTTDIGI